HNYLLCIVVRNMQILAAQNVKVKGVFYIMRKDQIGDVLSRLAEVYGAGTDTELARALDVTSSTISSWKARGSIPYAKCVEASQERGVSLDWLLAGLGSMYRNAEVQASGLNPRQAAILELFEALDGDAQREIQTAVEEKKRLIDLERRVAALEAAKKQA